MDLSRLLGASVKVTAPLWTTSAGVLRATAKTALMAGTWPARRAGRPLTSAAGAALQAVPESLGRPVRRCHRGRQRAWLEVRGLGEPGAEALGVVLVEALAAVPGVASAHLNRPLSRVIVHFAETPPTTRALCNAIADAERRADTRTNAASAGRSPHLPGDDGQMANRLLSVGVTAAGLYGAMVGRRLRLPRLPLVFGASVSVVNYQPRLRRLIEDQLGQETADRVLGIATYAARTAGQMSASLAVGLASRVARAAEYRASQRAWEHHEPQLAQYGECWDAFPLPERSDSRGAVEEHLDRSARAQLIGAAVVGTLTGDPDQAAKTALAAVPKAARTAREMFASTLGRGLANDHAVLPLRASVWRRLDRVDAVVIDPRTLCSAGLRVCGVRGVPDVRRSAVWEQAQASLDGGTMTPGWHPIAGPWEARADGRSDAEVLICHAHHPMASAVIAEARRSGALMVSVQTDDLGELASAFDELRPPAGASVDDVLAQQVKSLRESGRTVAMVSVAPQAGVSADVTVGLVSENGPPPWSADVLVDNLAAVWPILHALPAARSASRCGVEIAIGASLLASLLLVPRV